jgi:hypothetical protein
MHMYKTSQLFHEKNLNSLQLRTYLKGNLILFTYLQYVEIYSKHKYYVYTGTLLKEPSEIPAEVMLDADHNR